MTSQAQPLPDLPLELWTEIVSYLPRDAFHKLIGLNRHLLELVLDDKYETFHYTSNKNGVVSRIHEFKGFRIAQRIRHLMIHSAVTRSVSGNLLDLSAQWDVLACCVNIERVTIELYDPAVPPFIGLLTSLWKKIGRKLTTVSLKVPVSELAVILASLTAQADSILNLQKFHLTLISYGRPRPFTAMINNGVQSIPLFLTAFSRTLAELTICSATRLNLDIIFGKLVTLPKLKGLNLHSFLDDAHAFPTGEGFTNYIVKHAQHLESLVIDPNPRWGEPPDRQIRDEGLPRGYHVPVYSQELQKRFSNVKFPKLRTLQTVLRHPNLSPLGPTACLGPYSCLLPGFSSTTNLTTLKILSYPLIFETVATLVEHLGDGANGPSALKHLHLNVVALSPELFEMFAQHLAQLESLSLRFMTLNESAVNTMALTPNEFRGALTGRKFMQARMRWLRLTGLSKCWYDHPKPEVMKVVAPCWPHEVQLDNSYEDRCPCERSNE